MEGFVGRSDYRFWCLLFYPCIDVRAKLATRLSVPSG
jgi:hypothetical protein